MAPAVNIVDQTVVVEVLTDDPWPTREIKQATPAATWVIVHNENGYPAVIIVDNSRNVVEADVTYTDRYTATVHFSAPFAGMAYLD